MTKKKASVKKGPAPAEPPVSARRDTVAEANPEALFADGHDDAIIGIAERYGMQPVAAYNYRLVIEKLMKDGMSLDDAEEFFEFNIIGAWMGEATPVFIKLL